MNKDDFIYSIAKASKKYYNEYKILPSLTIAQAILESAWGQSGLSKDCFNYFGMKWTSTSGCKSKTYSSLEQDKNGKEYTKKSRFRKYDSVEAGIKGYFNFLQAVRYRNLKGVIDYKQACKLIHSDGWATDTKYAEKLILIIEKYNLTKFDNELVSAEKPEPRMKLAPKRILRKNPHQYPNRLLQRTTQQWTMGDDVKWVQYALVQLGYDLEIDGIFGPITEKTVLEAQKRFKIDTDGIVGKYTRLHLKYINV